MRPFYPLLLLLVSATLTAYAGPTGGEIRYEYAGGSNYRIELALYGECDGLGGGSSQVINLSSAACSLSQTATATLYQTDTIRDMWCPSASYGCGGTLRYTLVFHYRATASLSSCSDWKISYSACCRDIAVQNIPTAYSFYLEAFLNNSSAPNSSAFIDNYPPFLTGAGMIVSTPIHTTELDGDSVVVKMIVPQVTVSVGNATYASGFSATNPLGTGVPVTIGTSPDVMKTYGGVGGNSLAMRTYDYRSGVLVGYSSRDWTFRSGGTANPKVPLPTPTTSFDANICPGGKTTINLSFKDSVATDSVYADITGQPSVAGFTINTVRSPGVGTGSVTYTLTAPASLSAASNPYFIIPVFVRDNACSLRGYAQYNILLRVTSSCPPDTVWAGDANGDKTVDLSDPLYVAIANGKTGPLRPSASISWTAQPCGNWSTSFAGGVNIKHADCNGDGTINSSDLSAISTNFSMTHPKEVYQSQARITGIPDLYFDHTGVNINPGATVNIPIKLGSTTNTFSNIYGLAANLRVSGITPTFGGTPVTYPISWLGTAATTLQFAKTSTGNVAWAYARSNQQTTSGGGTLATLSFTIPASTPVGQKIVLTFNNVQVIDAKGNRLTGYNILSDTMTVSPLGVGSAGGVESMAAIVPNPSGGAASLQLDIAEPANIHVTVSDIAGRTVWQYQARVAAGKTSISLPASSLGAGLYMVQLTAGDAPVGKGLKWVRE